MIDWILGARFGLSIINLGMLLILIFIYFKRYRELTSPFTLGFLLFSLALFFRTFFAAPIVKVFFFGVATHSIVDPYRLVADVFEMTSLIILLYLTTR
jgi:hypothetical protein